jgi:predicted small lipoprotein YifL
MKSQVLSLVVLLTVFPLLCGCGSDRPAVVPVSGQVLIDGQPVADATLQFVPTGSRPARATTDAQGRFTATTFDDGDGCVPGTHKVVVVAISHPSPTEEVLSVPEKYMDLATTDVTVSIDQPTDDLKIELTWGDEKGPITRKVDAE